MNNKSRVPNFTKKLSGLQKVSSNNLDKFKKQCEDDFRRIISSFLKILKLTPQKGGVGNKGSPYTRVNNNQSRKSTVTSNKRKSSLISDLYIPNFYENLMSKKIPKTSIHECQIYDYLKKKSEFFIDKCTCFVRCSDDSVFLRDCGITFEELILENKNNVNLFQYILENLFEKIHFLHLLGIAHNNLDCSDVLVGKRDNINWTRMGYNQLKNLPANSYINIPFVRKNIEVRLINFSKATILQPGLEIDVDYLKGIFEHYTNSLQTLFP